ncbi:MAG: site-2 protease family protein [Candidatus Omnitrophica bacterium]|nr:site-2 protease family protein [Candidatus Omnitrophota bacterium]
MIAMSVHECAHSWVAYKLGDTTAKYAGRLTLNPLAHIDPLGTVLLPIFIFLITGGRFVFGAAKPVPINYHLLRNPKRDTIWIGLSGPASNFLFAFILSIINNFINPQPILGFVFENLIAINVILGVINLIPIPPLDGSRIVMGILPLDLAYRYAKVEPYGFFILMLLMMLGVFDILIWPVTKLILGWLNISF